DVSFGGIFGGKHRRLARITTPFILERANLLKGGDAKSQTFGRIAAGGGWTAEGVDARRRARPSPNRSAAGVPRTFDLDPRTGTPVTPRLALLFFLPRSSLPSPLLSARAFPS